ncbi:hypothetical protein Tco_0383644 [Tanacetum coccineum]
MCDADEGNAIVLYKVTSHRAFLSSRVRSGTGVASMFEQEDQVDGLCNTWTLSHKPWQYPYYGASVGATNGGMIIATGVAAAAAAFDLYLNMVEGYAQQYGTPIALAATPAMQPAALLLLDEWRKGSCIFLINAMCMRVSDVYYLLLLLCEFCHQGDAVPPTSSYEVIRDFCNEPFLLDITSSLDSELLTLRILNDFLAPSSWQGTEDCIVVTRWLKAGNVSGGATTTKFRVCSPVRDCGFDGCPMILLEGLSKDEFGPWNELCGERIKDAHGHPYIIGREGCPVFFKRSGEWKWREVVDFGLGCRSVTVGSNHKANPPMLTMTNVRGIKQKAAKLWQPKLVKLKAAPVKSNVGKRKRLVEDKEVEDECDSDVEGSDEESDSDKKDKGSEEADVNNESEKEVKDVKTKDNESEEAEESKEADVSNESEEEVKDVKIKVVKGKKKVVLSKSKKQNKEVEADVEGNESKEADESEEDNESEEAEESKEDKESEVAEEAKKRKHVSDSSEEEKVSKPKKVSKKKKQVSESSSSYEDEKPLKNKKKRSKRCLVRCLLQFVTPKLTWNPLCQILGFLHCTMFFIDTLHQRSIRFVVRAFSASSYEFKLDKGIIRVTPEKVYEILGVPLGGTLIFDLPEIPLDDPFVKEWFKNVMGTADTMKAIVNLTVLRHIREDTNIAEID